MKYNTTYIPDHDLLKTLKNIQKYKKQFISFLNSIFDLTKVTPALFLDEESDLLIDLSKTTRHITFDFGESYKTASLLLSHTNWMRHLISRLNLNNKQGFISESTFIWRDLVDNPTSTQSRDEITIQVKFASKYIYEFIKTLAQDIYELIWNMAEEISNEKGIRNVYPKFGEFISAQQLENEMPNQTFDNREIEMILEKKGFILKNAGKILFSGKVHKFLSPTLYELDNYYEILFKDRVNSNVLNIVAIGIIAAGEKLKTQLIEYNETKELEKNFISAETMHNYKILEIKINIPKLIMAIMAKGHIAEVQAGVISDEVGIIAKRNKIEVI